MLTAVLMLSLARNRLNPASYERCTLVLYHCQSDGKLRHRSSLRFRGEPAQLNDHRPGRRERFGKSVLTLLPISDANKGKLKSILFSHCGKLFSDFSSYRSWLRDNQPDKEVVAQAAPDELRSRLLEPRFYFSSRREWHAERDSLLADWRGSNVTTQDLAPFSGRPDDQPAEPRRRTEFNQVCSMHEARLPLATPPDVTIIVAVYNNVDLTLACLKSLALWPSKYSFEIIVADDASTDATEELLAQATGWRYLRNFKNLGFLKTCNEAAKLALGRYVAILNNDTFVLPNWLDELIDTFENNPGAGLAGSKLIGSDRSLQEAGGIIWEDASGWNFGRGESPRNPAYNFLRDVDYVSGASLAISADLWRELGGFDERYAPMYYEDTDLAFRVRDAGHRVLYQPLSMLIHHEGGTAGISLSEGAKHFQKLNQPKFQRRWHAVLPRHGSNKLGAVAADRRTHRRVLVVDSRTPMPDMDSGSVDCFEFLKIFKRLGFHVTFIPENLAHSGHYTEALQRIGVECLYRPFAESFVETVEQYAASSVLVLLYRAPVASQVIAQIRKSAPNAKIVFDTVDLHFLRHENEAALLGARDSRPVMAQAKRAELNVIRDSDCTIVVGTHELELLGDLMPDARCKHIPILREIPGRGAMPWQLRTDVMFIGGYEHPPNVDAAIFLVEVIWPLVRQRGTTFRLILAGSKMPERVAKLAADDIVIAGHVRDLEQQMNTLRLTVAPVRYGAGVKGKVISSLCHGVPCVATVAAAAGTNLVDGEDIVIADDPVDFADAVVALYDDRSRWERISEQGLASCRQNYSVPAVTTLLTELLTELGVVPEREDKAL